MGFLKGRTNRAVFWLNLGIVIAAVTAVSLFMRRAVGVSEVLLAFVCIPRLHDIGRSGWLLLYPLAFEFIVVAASLALLPLELAAIPSGLTVLIFAGLLIWLGAIPGDPGANRFGKPPRRGLRSWNSREYS